MELTFERIADPKRVRAAITRPGVWEASGDDFAPAPEDWQPNEHPAIWYVMASDELGEIALYTLLPQNGVCWEVHTTRVFGRRALGALRAVVPWICERTSCRRVVAAIPAMNRAAIRHAERAGFVRYGLNPRSFRKGGNLTDTVLLGRE